MAELKNQNQNKRLPDCAIEGCSNFGWVMLGGQYVCGECTIRYEKNKNKMVLDSLKK